MHARRAVLTVGLAGWCGLALADGFRNPPPDAASLGRAGNSAAQVDTPAAVTLNPALLAGQTQPAAEFSASFARLRTEISSPLGRSVSHDDWQILPNVFAVYPAPDSAVVLGIGLTTPYGQAVEWDRDYALSGLAPYSAEMALVAVQPAAALRLGPDWSVGAGVDVYVANLTFKQVFPWSAVFGPAAPAGTLKADGDAQAVSGHAGLAWEPAPGHRLALAYRGAADLDFDGDARLHGAPLPLPGLDGDFETTLRLPDIVTAAYGVRVTDTLQLEADAEWLGWSRYDRQTVGLAIPAAPVPLSRTLPQRWEDTWTFGGAAAWQVTPAWTLRAGYTWLPSPVPESTLAPTLPDADRHVVSFGLGYSRGHHRVDVGCSLSLFEDATATVAGPAGALPVNYELDADLFGVAYLYTF